MTVILWGDPTRSSGTMTVQVLEMMGEGSARGLIPG
ncbi:hypothetical protein FHX05_005876 [Rhizobium sp. BK491]|nr:hypothetical protein [Rhizobium sp. BK491]